MKKRYIDRGKGSTSHCGSVIHLERGGIERSAASVDAKETFGKGDNLVVGYIVPP